MLNFNSCWSNVMLSVVMLTVIVLGVIPICHFTKCRGAIECICAMSLF
jgi:hypothetical protein